MAEAHPTVPGTRIQDLTKMGPFGSWTVLGLAPTTKCGMICWFCRCECGTESVVQGGHLKSGRSTQCRACSNRKDGRTTLPEYGIWRNIIQRCENQNVPNYNRYGGRGTKICQRWRESFTAFLSDMGPRPSTEHSIDRFPNQDGDYEPGNCRWATVDEQARNRRSNRMLALNGRTQCAADWADELGIHRATFYKRIASGWDDEKILTQPVTEADD